MPDWTWTNVDDYHLYVAMKTSRKEVIARDNYGVKAGSECRFVSIARLNTPKL
jgi:hypothetical protein